MRPHPDALARTAHRHCEQSEADPVKDGVSLHEAVVEELSHGVFEKEL